MRFILPTLLMLASKVLATPVDPRAVSPFGGEEELLAPNDVDTVASLEFIGPVTPGGPNVTLYGTAKGIYEQIIKLNPEYDVFAFPENAAEFAAEGLTREDIETSKNPARSLLASRDLDKRGQYNCKIGKYVGNFNTQCVEGLLYLRRLGQSWCGAKARSCARVSCSHNCGMYLCSKLKKEKKVRCASIAKDISHIAGECGVRVGTSAFTVLRARGRKHFNSHNIELSSTRC
ncbi:hypothetical protein GGS23DRAFT_581115 [Durotheca rogersii]|uniref:uncharacterized protein n=1 Tax=Durotheca rogersii TaxID=419775 RepID=UPI002220C5B1|nr:uncharacterized protein GGS23DRAFT_581115 [Durotheca rogersii]KAI5860362.1 hypothetical protein GGS23DRAFT_581115 [Durotheca rogersii]